MNQIGPTLRDKPVIVPGRLVQLSAQKGPSQGMGQVVGRPVHPLLDLLTRREIRGIQGLVTGFRSQISDDRIGLPHHGSPVDHHRDLGRRVQGQELRAGAGPETATVILPLIGQSQFVTRP